MEEAAVAEKKKRKKPVSQVAKCLERLRSEGYCAEKVERWNSFARIRQDFGGFADIVAWKAGEMGALAIQACADSGVGAHVTKLTNPPDSDRNGADRVKKIAAWLASSNRLEIWSFAQRGARGERKTWRLRRIIVTPTGTTHEMPSQD